MILNQQIIVLNTEVTYYDVNQQLFHKDNCPEFIMPMIDRFKLLNYMKLTAKGSLFVIGIVTTVYWKIFSIHLTPLFASRMVKLSLPRM